MMSKLGKRTMKWLTLSLSLVLILGVLAGCMGRDNTGSVDDEQRVLRIGMMQGSRDYDEHIRSQYTDIFKFNNMNIDIEFVYAYDYTASMYNYDVDQEQPDPLEEMKKLMQGPNPPDVVLLQSTTELAALVDENLLTPLEPLISTDADKFDISDFVPAVIDGLKAAGNDELYALAPMFNSQALIFNKGIFNERNVEYPTDGMYWEDVFDLASRVTHGEDNDRVAGFSFGTYYGQDIYYGMREAYIAPLELSMFTDDKESMLVDSPSWEDVWNQMVRLNDLDVLPGPPDYSNWDMGVYNRFQHDAFMSGKLAMAVVDYYFINDIIRANRDADLTEGYEYIDWDVVTMPVHPQNPLVGGPVHMNPIMGINAKAQNSEDAWRFIKFLNGENWAQLKSQSSYQMVSRGSHIKPAENAQFNIEAFYTLMPAPVNTDSIYYMGRNSEVYWQLENIGAMKFNEVLNGQTDVKQALQQWQTEGNTLLQLVRDNPDRPIWELYNEMQGIDYGHVMPMPMPIDDVIWEDGESIDWDSEDIIWDDIDFGDMDLDEVVDDTADESAKE